MAVKINTGLTLTDLTLALWGTPMLGAGMLGIAAELQDAKYTLWRSASSLKIIDGNGKIISTTDIKASVLKEGLKQNLSTVVMDVLKKKVTTLLDWAHQHKQKADIADKISLKNPSVAWNEYKEEIMDIYHGKADTSVWTADGTGYYKVAAIKKLRELTGGSLYDAKHCVDGWVDDENWDDKAEEADAAPSDTVHTHDSIYITTNSVIPLPEADYLHQPVHGSSTGSRYYVVAIGSGVKVAARIKQDATNSIAIRAVCTGPQTTILGQHIVEGFERANLKQKNGHWSLHLTPDSVDMALRSIGATLFAMQLDFTAVSGKLTELVNK